MTANSKRQESWFKLAFWKRGKKSNDLLNKKDRIKCMLEGIVIIRDMVFLSICPGTALFIAGLSLISK